MTALIANAEDPQVVYVEQLRPFTYGNWSEPIFKVRITHRPGDKATRGYIMVPELSDNPNFAPWRNLIKFDAAVWPEDLTIIDDETSELIFRVSDYAETYIGQDIVPGEHLGIVQVFIKGIDGWGNYQYYSQITTPFGVMPIKVYAEA